MAGQGRAGTIPRNCMSAKKAAAAAVLRHFGDDVEEIRDDRGGGEDASMRIADSADNFTLTLQVAMKMEGGSHFARRPI